MDPITNQLRHSRIGGRPIISKDVSDECKYGPGRRITREEAEMKGWIPQLREPKHRYIFLVGNKTQKKEFRLFLKYKAQNYPSP